MRGEIGNPVKDDRARQRNMMQHICHFESSCELTEPAAKVTAITTHFIIGVDVGQQ
jgi:hypothetical protein